MYEFSCSSVEHCFHHEETKLICLVDCRDRWHDQFLASTDDIHQCSSTIRQCFLQRASQVLRLFKQRSCSWRLFLR